MFVFKGLISTWWALKMSSFRYKKIKNVLLLVGLCQAGKDPPNPDVSFLQVYPAFKLVFILFNGRPQTKEEREKETSSFFESTKEGRHNPCILAISHLLTAVRISLLKDRWLLASNNGTQKTIKWYFGLRESSYQSRFPIQQKNVSRTRTKFLNK